MPRGIPNRVEARDEARLPARDPNRERTRKRKGDYDDFWVDLSKKPDDQDWNWKRFETYGQPDRQNVVAMGENGWEPVDATIFEDGRSGPLENKGLVLCERPKELSEEARREENAKAAAQLRNKEAIFGQSLAPSDPRDASPRTRPSIQRAYAPMEVAE